MENQGIGQGKMRKSNAKVVISSILIVVILLALALVGGSFYMLSYSLSYTKKERKSAEQQMLRIKEECPWTVAWIDSVYEHRAVRDTFVVMPSGYKAHAIYLYAPRPTNKTAVVVHGYKLRAEGMLHIAYLYNHDLGYNVLLPDLYGHGKSEGDHIQMGWKDRWDVIKWSEIAHQIFASKNEQMVLHGISMGAATVMAVSGEKTPDYIKCFVEDCGYTSVWDEFAAQLKDQFNLPQFPLMNITSELCLRKYGWSFGEARQIDQVRKCRKPMLFIHGDDDDFVPSWMVHPLYEAKVGKKQIYIAHGSDHTMSYRDHHAQYTRVVREFLAH